jgi:stearoyl-CoA desaturase (Delta-9 desaturase)
MSGSEAAAQPGVTFELHHIHLFYVAMHIALLAALLTGGIAAGAALAVSLYLIRSAALVIGYHRYFAHRSFKTSRAMQFILAVAGSLGAERGPLWWADTHRYHHRYADTPRDIHSPHVQGFLYAHSGWFMDKRHRVTDLARVPDLARFPELVWIDRFNYLPHILLAAALYLALGWPGLLWGYCVSTVLVWHSTHVIQSFAHSFGTRRYPTSDESRNSFLLALLTLGEGWHNNHHYFPASSRAGFRWWEIDPCYYVLRILSWLGLIWDLRQPPHHLRGGDEAAQFRFVEAFEQRVLDFRDELESIAEAEASTSLRQMIADEIDDFRLGMFERFVRGPQALWSFYAAKRDAIAGRGAELGAGDRWPRAVEELFAAHEADHHLLGPGTARLTAS